jgi:hypothetical protein
MKQLCAGISLWLAAVAWPAAQTPAQIALHVSEPGGIRRTVFPVNARVPFPRGVLHDSSHAHLVLGQAEVPSQMTSGSRWPDGSVQWLDVDFNASLDAMASQDYAVEFGDDIHATPPRGLTMTEEAGSILIGNIRLNRSGAPLLAAVTYRDEAIAVGRNGLVVTDLSGNRHELSAADGLQVEIVKRGPLYVQVRYSGTPLDRDARATFVLDVEMPNSKSWVRLSAQVDDPARRVRDIAFDIPLALGSFPWVWDFGTTRWTYGQLRNATDAVTLTDTRQASGTAWTVSAGPAGHAQIVETSAPDRATFNRWGHVQGAKEAVAFAIEQPVRHDGTTRVTFEGSGQTSFIFAPRVPETRHELAVVEHFVSTPVQIGAATSPAAILAPLVARCDRAQYVKSGVAVPLGVK